MWYSRDSVNSFFTKCLKNFDTIVAHHANKYATARIKSEMIDAALNIRERNRSARYKGLVRDGRWSLLLSLGG
jgi:hypothetical protein